MSVLIVAPCSLILLRPHAVGPYLIALFFLPGIIIAFRGRKLVQFDSNRERLLTKWTLEGRPKVYTMPYLMPVVPPALKPVETVSMDEPASDLTKKYRSILQSRIRTVAFACAVMLVGLPAIMYLVTTAIQIPFKPDLLLIPLGFLIYYLLVNAIEVRKEFKSMTHFDRWVAEGCPSTISFDKK